MGHSQKFGRVTGRNLFEMAREDKLDYFMRIFSVYSWATDINEGVWIESVNKR